MKILHNVALAAVIAAVIAAAACGGGGSETVSGPTGGNPSGGNPSGGGSTAPVSTNAVSVTDNSFTPQNIQVGAGTTVTWTWPSGVSLHNVTFTDGTQSGDKAAGATFSRTFSTAGTFNYSCTLHSGMNGSVRVN